MPFKRDPLLEKFEPVRRLGRTPAVGYAVAVLSVGLATLLRFQFGGVPTIGIFITFYLAVIATGIIGRLRPGIIATVLSVLAADFFFIPPVYQLIVTTGQGLALLLFGFNLTLIVLVISFLHEVLDRLWRQERDLRFVLENEPVGLIAIDSSGGISLVNAAIEKQFGYSREELIGQKIDCLLPERFRVMHANHRNTFMQHPEARMMSAGRDLFGLRRDGTEIPVEIGLKPIRRGGTQGALATVLDISERKSAERHQQIMMREIQHRAGNLLTVVLAIVTRTLTAQNTTAEARQKLCTLIAALGRTQDLFATKGAAHLREVVELELASFSSQVTIGGDAIALAPKAAKNFSLIVHELRTNALKYGALSRAEGAIAVEWRKDGETLVFDWMESGGPPVMVPQHNGLGQTILKGLAKEFSTDVSLRYEGQGFQYSLMAPWPRVAALTPSNASVFVN